MDNLILSCSGIEKPVTVLAKFPDGRIDGGVPKTVNIPPSKGLPAGNGQIQKERCFEGESFHGMRVATLTLYQFCKSYGIFYWDNSENIKNMKYYPPIQLVCSRINTINTDIIIETCQLNRSNTSMMCLNDTEIKIPVF